MLAVLAALAGCSALNDDTLDPSGGGLEGSWAYLATNAYDAVFTGCTGDAAVLEGLSFVEGMEVAPICAVAGSFDVVQDGDEFAVVPFDVICSDGWSGTIAGGGSHSGTTLAGSWESTSGSGVTGVQSFSGSITGGNVAEILENRRTFSGGFEGSCDLSPPLRATVRID